MDMLRRLINYRIIIIIIIIWHSVLAHFGPLCLEKKRYAQCFGPKTQHTV